MGIPEIIKEIRNRKGYSQKKLAQILNVSQSAVFQWENGTRKPKIEQLEKLSEILESDETAFIDIMENPEKWGLPDNPSNEEKLFKKIKTFDRTVHAQEGETRLLIDYRSLNNTGKKEAIKRISELTEIKKYTDPEE